MKKIYVQLITDFMTFAKDGIRSFKLFLIALTLSCFCFSTQAQVVIIPANDTVICSRTAVTGTAPSCSNLGAITITETLPSDFALGADQIILNTPANWQFCTGAPVVMTAAGGGDISGPVTFSYTGSNTLTINFSTTGGALPDQITITGLQVQPTLTTAAPGDIFCSAFTGVIGITPGISGTSFGRLACIPLPITGVSNICVGSCSVWTSSPGVTWATANAGIASVNAGGNVCGVSAGSTNITATLSGCTVVQSVSVLAGPAPITGAHTMCAWFDTLTVHDATLGGLFSSRGVTVVNVGPGTGFVHSQAPGVDTIFYTSPSGCITKVIVTVNPLPGPFGVAPFQVCLGSSAVFSFPPGPNTFSVTPISIGASATATPFGTDSLTFTGTGVGTVKVIGTSTITGCKRDTTFTINPVPVPISGTLEICELESTTLIDSPAGGTWSISGGAATISSTSIIGTRAFCTLAGNAPAPYTTLVTYTLPTGCFAFATLTVDALPAPISGAHALCVNDSTLLTDASPGGTWTSTNTLVAVVGSSSGMLRGVGAGIDTIIYKINPGGCTAMFIVTVNPLPTGIFGTDHVCVGQSAPESGVPAGGTWSATPTTIGIVDVVGMVTGVSAGTVKICYTLGTGCALCKDVTVDPLPAPIVGPDTVCVTNTIHLTDATPGGTWFSSDMTYVTIDTLGNATGVAPNPTGVRVDYIYGNCSVSIIITVNPYPFPIHGPVGVCIGDTATLTDSLPGGIWFSSDTTVAKIDSFTGKVVGLSIGGVIISYYSNHGCGVAYPLAVYNKAPITGPDNVCVGQTIVLCDTASGGVWTHINPSADILTTLVGCVSVLGTGTTTATDSIIYTMGTGCRSAKAITVNPISPIFGIPSSVCLGFTGTVTDATPGGTWSVSDPTKATISSGGFVTTLDTGIVIITYLMPTGCQASFVLFINPNPAPINIGPGRLCAGDSLLLTDVDTGGAWFAIPPGVATIGGITGMVHGVAGGVSIITYTLSTGCFTTTLITVDPIGPITGPNQVCVNDSIILIDTFGASAGFFTSSDNLIATVHATTGKVHGISAGVVTITYTMPGSGCYATYQITVNPLPGFIGGPDSVCQFNTITLTNVVPLGTWTSSNPSVASIGATSGILSGNTPGIVTITYMLPTGCYVTKLVTVNLTPAPIAGITHVCLGRQITMTDPTPGGIWTSTNSGIPITSGGVVSGNILDTTIITYTLPVGGCFSNTIVTVNPIPTLTINPNPVPIKCKYATQVLTASGAGAGGIYNWSPATGLSGTVGPVVVCNATVTTTYTVKGTTQWGCDTTATVTVVVDDSLDHMRIVGKDNICEGECDTLMASGRAHTYFNWHPASGLSCTICDTVSACPTKTTQYWAVAIDDIGCKDSVSFTVNVRPLPLLHVNPSPTVVCRGRPLQLKVGSNTTDSTTDVYSWSPNLFISCDTCDNPILIDTANIVYRVTGTSIFGCHDSLNVKVSVLDTNRNTISHDTDICYGGTALLVATSHSVFSNLDIPTYTWFPVWALSAPDSAMTFANPSSTATYSVAIHENACWDDTLAVTVRVQPYPTIYLTANASTNIVAGTPVQLSAVITNTPIQQYVWSPGGTLSCDSCFNPIATPTVNTTYTVTVTSIYGCTTTDTISLGLYCDNSQIFIPNTFTPNGDGTNDLFYVSGKGIKIITLMQVYNRWGQMVFEAHNIPPNAPGAGWDGTFKGLVLEPDVFVYVVKAQCELGTTTYSYTGDVSIVK